MRIGVFGATGVIGSRVVAEAVARGHDVTAFTRDATRVPAGAGQVTWRVADVMDVPAMTEAIAGLDVIVNALNAGRDIPETIANAHVFPAAARSLLEALESHPAARLIVVGGAGSLEVRPGLQVVDTEGFAEGLPANLGVPEEYVKVVLAHREALALYRLSNRRWTYLSPSSGRVDPGERTGRFRVGGDRLLVRDDGTSAISAEDLAVAVVDEAELPRHVQRRFTVGY
ncbi:Rrf2-linked NADH-flavin reductase [[Actinomadura] parvosata subsp. kistnae]|uniref:Epimerase n=1 Tax=[Actinomadura] parvosata subsp. kistnae TaxID=1909395 RepID=A0A1V0A4X1_9ACTN|nr:NAD(P)H-binding protein [Nonomuraea sp. ATCC 55076]AQZ65266.1 epimerase [Nonomuraea sp. ATCC 55076]SPL96576.1 Rrf2-linked NADH-flavin reductase [Actinomadura parvosata subsp. kistnae]